MQLRKTTIGLCLATLVAGFFIGQWLEHKKHRDGYTTEYGDFIPWACERTKGNSDALPNGVQRFLVHTGPDFETICNQQGYVTPADCKEPQSPKWAGETVWIDYEKQHRVCVTNIQPFAGPQPLCFDLYDIGER